MKKTHTVSVDSHPKAPGDMEKLKGELFSKERADSETAKLGENRGQLFIRLPTRMTKKLELRGGDVVKINLVLNEKERKIIIEASR